ncbi:unnamed protein product [Euphydryas editha]|uniref:HTH psq-type domain-containing protein n=1 Tax=Euphydryas editha TaxID=104508 RepID=A0AAU9UY12_EUPED|nr:unnamed protein product [Euphydryas editha]
MATSPKFKKRKTWEKEEMATAIAAVREKRMGYLKAAKQFNVPRATLFRFVNDKDSPIESIINKADKCFPAARIFNVDESGLSIVQSKIPKIIARKGKKQIGAMTSAERGSLITIVICMSPAGIFVPPMIIFPRKNMSNALMRGAPVGSIGRVHPSGWIQTHLFTEWFQHFVEYVKPTEASPVLLILDGHYSHTKNIELIDLAKQNHVTILSLPPHCTHKVQPLDRSFMGPLKSYYSEEVRLFLRETNRPLTPYDVVELFAKLLLMVSELLEYIRLIEIYLLKPIT